MCDVLAVVVTHNRLELLKKCVAALEAQSERCDILLVDNASDDQTPQWAEQARSANDRISCVRLEQNTGGAGGFYFGMKWAVERGYRFAWLRDDDCIVCGDSLQKLLEADSLLGGPEQYGFLSSVVLWKDGRDCVMNHPTVDKRYYTKIEALREGILRINQATFVSLFLPVRTIREFGYVIREYFIWNDDIEYTRRLARRGQRPSYLVGQSQVYHMMENNGGNSIATDDIARLWRYVYAYRNESYTYRREGPVGIAKYAVRCARDVFRVLAYARDHKFRRLGAILRGAAKGLVFHPKVEYPAEQTGAACPRRGDA